MSCSRDLCRMPPACIVGFLWVETARQHTKEMWEGTLFPLSYSSVSECGGCLCSHLIVVSVLCIHDLSKEDIQTSGWIKHNACWDCNQRTG